MIRTLHQLIDLHKETFYTKENDKANATLKLYVQAAFVMGAFSLVDINPPKDVVKVFKSKELLAKENCKDFDFTDFIQRY